jgi:uncharacterized protein (TIGR02145 family)
MKKLLKPNENRIRFVQFMMMGVLLILTSYCRTDNTKKTQKIIEKGTVIDIEGSVYQTVKIGDQWWMAENLRTTKTDDGTTLSLVTENTTWGKFENPAYCWYDNDATTNKSIYGALYNWYSANSRVCPIGWHVPSVEEWTTLAMYLGSDVMAGGKLKENGIMHWEKPNTEATNESGFIGLPGGLRYSSGEFSDIGKQGMWWSFNKGFFEPALIWSLSYENRFFNHFLSSDRELGLSIRCVKDNN